ncbi:MAG TPA: hypothetical protein DDX68_02860, partial [Clostridium sp.]|nr:hypothetical protein [Clostridium sp.]
MDEIAACVSDVLKKNDFLIPGAAYQNLVVHLYIAISRIMECHYVPMPEEPLKNFNGRDEYQIAKEILKKIESTFHISFPETEIVYIAIHLAGKKMIYHSDEADQ